MGLRKRVAPVVMRNDLQSPIESFCSDNRQSRMAYVMYVSDSLEPDEVLESPPVEPGIGRSGVRSLGQCMQLDVPPTRAQGLMGVSHKRAEVWPLGARI